METDPKRYVIGPDATIDDVDLDKRYACAMALGSPSSAPGKSPKRRSQRSVGETSCPDANP